MTVWIFVAQVNIAGAMLTPVEELKYILLDRKTCELMIKDLSKMKCIPLTVIISER